MKASGGQTRFLEENLGGFNLKWSARLDLLNRFI
jgi:hypothetical protein